MGTPLFEVIIMVRFNRWISADEIDEYRECAFDEFHEDLLIKELVNHKYIICGDTHQSGQHRCVPLFSDGYLLLSMRKWAEVMNEAHLYMNPLHHEPHLFYMKATCELEENLPCCQ